MNEGFVLIRQYQVKSPDFQRIINLRTPQETNCQKSWMKTAQGYECQYYLKSYPGSTQVAFHEKRMI